MIHVERLSREFSLSPTPRGTTLRERIASVFNPRWFQKDRLPISTQRFLALDDVNFQINRGETVGVIGRNGAGKSTLLKILSRVLKPTSGRVTLLGRVGSLLEVGAGFHPELSGRDNIFLHGAILGMKRAEIARKFDEIVAFAGTERFLDIPVKRYSTGMYLRLAFSVAAHIEPEILLLDEVLAVGDADFQKKCLGRIGEAAREGRTVLLVSHNLHSVTRLCERTLWLDSGRLVADGPSAKVVSDFLKSGTASVAHRVWEKLEHAPGNEVVRLRGVRILDQAGKTVEAALIHEVVGIEIEFEIMEVAGYPVATFTLHDETGGIVFWAGEPETGERDGKRTLGKHRATAWIPGNFLATGWFGVAVSMQSLRPSRVHLEEPSTVAFQVLESSAEDTARGIFPGNLPGLIRPKLNWTSGPQIS